jgi:hypothetical protein
MISPDYDLDQILLARNYRKPDNQFSQVLLSHDGGHSWKIIDTDQVIIDVHIRHAGFPEQSAAPPPPGPHLVYLPLVSNSTRWEYWFIVDDPTGYLDLYHSYDLEAKWNQVWVFVVSQRVCLPLITDEFGNVQK